VEGLLGRGEERSRLDQILARARHGHSGALVIRGEPGVGSLPVGSQAHRQCSLSLRQADRALRTGAADSLASGDG